MRLPLSPDLLLQVTWMARHASHRTKSRPGPSSYSLSASYVKDRWPSTRVGVMRATRQRAANADGQLAVLGYQHMTLKEPSLMGLNWYSEESLSRR